MGVELLSDEELIARVALPDHPQRDAAFTELVGRYEGRVYRICFRYFGDHADAADATQDTFLQVLRRAGTFRAESRFSTWLYRVAVNACNDLARRRRRRRSTPVAELPEVAAPDGAVDASPLVLSVQQALTTLDDTSRMLLILVAVEGLSYAEAAEIAGLPVGTVKSRVHRARARLAALLVEAGSPEAPS